ncbi:hypothetical protein ABZU32_40200 [Sphaerisporangium sp. NPDC005288]|uniref:hypothetical protein n=1 Tax=Sphaerisporangium sp. NPDC005288 TaxID=3155114 RepID=UPI0033B4F2D5
MNVEEALKEAMSAHVADVRAPAMMGQAVRRRHRAHLTRFRTAGAAALTVLVAGSFPAYTALTSGPAPAPAPSLGGPAAAPSDPAAVPSDESTAVASQSPSAGVDAGSPAPATSATAGASPIFPDGQLASQPQDLGDLGDGRAFGGVRVDYLPERLQWGKWSGKNGFGETSYTTSWDEPGALPGMYGVQMIVFEGDASKRVKALLHDHRNSEDAERVEVHGAQGVIAKLGEGSEIDDDMGTSTILWMLKPDLAVEAMISPTLAERLGPKGVVRELKRIADGVHATG